MTYDHIMELNDAQIGCRAQIDKGMNVATAFDGLHQATTRIINEETRRNQQGHDKLNAIRDILARD